MRSSSGGQGSADPLRSQAGTAALALLLLADGVAIGLVSVFFLPLRAGAAPLPVIAVVAAAANLAVVMLAARLTDKAAVMALPLAGWLVVYLLAAAGGPGGDKILPSDWRALLLLFLGLLPAALWLGNHALARSYAKGAAAR